MNRLRTLWLAIAGGALLLALSASGALGAPPAADDTPNFGQQVSTFVHELLGPDEDQDEDGDEDQVEDEDGDDDQDEEQVEDQQDEDGKFFNGDETTSCDFPEEDTDLGEDWNHGAFVSTWARWFAQASDEDLETAAFEMVSDVAKSPCGKPTQTVGETELTSGELGATAEEGAGHGKSGQPHGKAGQHGKSPHWQSTTP